MQNLQIWKRPTRLSSATRDSVVFVRCLFAVVMLAVASVASAPAFANHTGGRYITINSERLSDQQIVQADRNVGFRLPNGHYWWDLRTGFWGVVGGPPLGFVSPALSGGGSQQGGGGRANGRHFNTLIDPSGGCEGGSCVNIID